MTAENDTAWNLRDLDTISPAHSQAWAVAVIYRHGRDSISYSVDETDHRLLVAESDDGRLYAAKPGTDDWWDLFDATIPEHRAAAEESARRRLIVFIEFEAPGEVL